MSKKTSSLFPEYFISAAILFNILIWHLYIGRIRKPIYMLKCFSAIKATTNTILTSCMTVIKILCHVLLILAVHSF